MPRIAKAAVSWSGGKDGCLALLRAQEDGLRVATALTMFDDGGRSLSHALPRPLVGAQVEALGLQRRAVEVGAAGYAAALGDALATLVDDGHTHLVFGDIDLQAHRDWLEPMCDRAGLEAVFPLWGDARRDVADEIVARGIRARVVCVDTRWLGPAHCGVEYDRAFIASLPAGVCPCGEGGEFHTFVRDAPGFAAPLRLARGTQRRERSLPPLSPTELVFEIPVLVEEPGGTATAGRR